MKKIVGVGEQGDLDIKTISIPYEARKTKLELDEKNICVSSGSACSSGSASPSHVLTAINTPDEYINSAIRTTFSENNTFEEINYLVKSIVEIVKSQ